MDADLDLRPHPDLFARDAVGGGTARTLRLPPSAACSCGSRTHCRSARKILRMASEPIQSLQGRGFVVVRGETVLLVRLRWTFGRDEAPLDSSSDAACVVVVGLADRRLGRMVGRLVGEQEVLTKSLNRFSGEVRGISGATIFGDGNVARIVDGIVSEAVS